ncbi:MAG: hypothetical protein ACR2GX_01940 [Candidatus Dormibacteria bacterium]
MSDYEFGPGTGALSSDPLFPQPLTERRKLVRRRRQMLTLREWVGVAGISAIGLLLAAVTVVGLLAH